MAPRNSSKQTWVQQGSFACKMKVRVPGVRRPLAGVIGAHLYRRNRRRARGRPMDGGRPTRKATNMPTKLVANPNGASNITSGLLLASHARRPKDATEHGGVSAGAYNGYRDLWDMWGVSTLR